MLKISHATAIILMASFAIYIIFNAFSHDNIFSDILEADEEADHDRHIDLAKPKFTFLECIIAIVLALTFISLIAVFLVEEIPNIVAEGVPDMFLGLILVPLVEKAAEHLTAIDEAYDNQINFALYHCLGPSIQTALFNAPLVVMIGWGLGKPMDLNFEIFMIVLVILSILVVGNFLRDGSVSPSFPRDRYWSASDTGVLPEHCYYWKCSFERMALLGTLPDFLSNGVLPEH